MSRKLKLNLTPDQILGKVDNIISLVSAISDVAKTAKKAKEDGVITEEEILAIKAKAQEIVDLAQDLADEVIEELIGE